MKITCLKSGTYGANRSRYNAGDAAVFDDARAAQLIEVGAWAPVVEPGEQTATEPAAMAESASAAAPEKKAKRGKQRDRAIDEQANS